MLREPWPFGSPWLASAVAVVYLGGMVLATRLLPAAGGGASVAFEQNLLGVFNAAPTSAYVYSLGSLTSTDRGATVTPGGSAILAPGSGWQDVDVKDPAVIHDGSQFVIFWCGFDGSGIPSIGYGTAADWTDIEAGTFTQSPSNPTFDTGTGYEGGAAFPTPLYVAGDPRPYKLWFAAFPTGSSPASPGGLHVMYSDSTDLTDWSVPVEVIGLGTSGAFDDFGLQPGAVYKLGPTYYVFVSGFRSDLFSHSGYAMTTDPSDPDAYSATAVLPGFDAPISLVASWRSNLIRSLVRQADGTFRFFGTIWNPVSGTEEISFDVTGGSLTTPDVGTISQTFGLAGYYANSGENPWLIVSP